MKLNVQKRLGFTTQVVAVVFVCFFNTRVFAQSKLYISGGISTVFGSGLNIFLGNSSPATTKYNYRAFDLEYEKRLYGSFSLVSGLSYFNAGYKTDDPSFSALSEFVANYAAVPLMARWNAGNKNFFVLDFGIAPFYLVNAHLKETITKFNSPTTVEGDITKYSNRFYFGYKVQMLFLVNRFYIGLFVIAPAQGQTSLRGLNNHWGLNAQQSTYLLSNGFSDFFVSGLKLGVRIK